MKNGKADRKVNGQQFSASYLKRKQDAEEKKKIARRMLKKGKSNDIIKECLRKKYGSAVGPDTLATIRVELGQSGPNSTGGRGTRKKCKAKPKAKTPAESLLVLKDSGTSEGFRSALQSVLDRMPSEGVQAFAVRADGTVRVQQVHEFLLTPPAGAEKLGGGL